MSFSNIISRSFLLLILFSSVSFASFHTIYTLKNENYNYSIENNNYKVILKDIGFISNQKSGFKLYLPNFLKEYNLEILRVSSIGHIDGYLSNKISFNKEKILNVKSHQLDYYYTDYSDNTYRQLDYVLNNKVIPYKNATSLVIEGYNLPSYVNKKLNKWIYFVFDKSRENKLKELSYSFSMILNKNDVDNYVRKNLKVISYKNSDFKYIHTYMQNLSNPKKYTQTYVPSQKKEIPKRNIVVEKPKVSFSLDKKREYSLKPIKGLSLTKDELHSALDNKEFKKYEDLIHYNLGVIYAKQNSNLSNKKAIWHFKNSKQKEAYFNLGVYYYLGLSIKENDKKAYENFKKSSELGFERATSNIKIMEEFKIGI